MIEQHSRMLAKASKMGTNIKQYSITSPWLQTDCGLGEAPFWERTRNHLRFVDIVKKHMYFVDLNDGPSSLRKHQLDFSVSTTADIRGNSEEFIFGGKLGYGLYQRSTGTTRWLRRMWNDEERMSDGGGKPGKGDTHEQRMRSNDGMFEESDYEQARKLIHMLDRCCRCLWSILGGRDERPDRG